MFELVGKSIASLRHKAVIWLVFASIAATILILFSLIWLVGHLLVNYQFIHISWLETIIDSMGTIAAAFIAWILFPAVVPAIAGLFEDKVAYVIEANEYGITQNAHSYPWYKEVRFLLFGLFLNIIFLPVYLVPVVNIFAYYFLNSWLMGKGLFMLIATRTHGPKHTKILAAKHSFKIKILGLLLVFMTNIPVINLIAPLFGIILMVHYSRSLSPAQTIIK